MAYEHAVKRVSKRDWLNVQTAWAPAISRLRFSSAGQQPEFPFDETAGLTDLLQRVKGLPEIRLDVGGFGAPLLHEGVYLLHKSANVLVAAHDQVYGGLPTWSLSTAYQAAYFAAEAIMRLLGVTVVSYVKQNYALDLLPAPPDKLSKKALSSYVLGSELHVINIEASISHFHRWAFFQRVISNSKNTGFDDEILKVLIRMDEKHFGMQRNDLHYSHTWLYSDLHSYHEQADLLSFQSKDDLLGRLRAGNPAFSLTLGMVVFSFGIKLLKDLSQHSPVLAAEFELLKDTCTMPRLKLKQSFEDCVGYPVF